MNTVIIKAYSILPSFSHFIFWYLFIDRQDSVFTATMISVSSFTCFSNRHLFLFKDSIPTANPRTLEMTGYDDHTVLTEKQKTEFVTKVTRY